jgi:hypothetical protein
VARRIVKGCTTVARRTVNGCNGSAAAVVTMIIIITEKSPTTR